MKGEVKRAFVGRTSIVPRRGTSPFMGEAGRGPSRLELMSNSPTFADWAKLAQKDLRDTPVDSLNRNYGDLPIRPAYFPADATDPGLPGTAPFTRGVRATMYAGRPWTIRQYAGFSTARESTARTSPPAKRA